MAATGKAHVLTEISPTYVSTDLLTPHQKQRLTIPAIGHHSVPCRPIGGKTWGQNLTTYGGIGKLPFLGKTRARDLYVTRSLKHFGSGFSQYKSNIQPYQVTSLLKSACRGNDQTIPPTFTIELDPEKYKLDYHDQIKERNPYFSHQSIFEVFPRHDPKRFYLPGNKLMTDNTRQELMEKYRAIYNVPRYSNVYPDHSDVMRERALRVPRQTPMPYEGSGRTSDDCQCDVTDSSGNSCQLEKCSGDNKERMNREMKYLSKLEYETLQQQAKDMEPLCLIISQLGSSMDVFTVKDILGFVLQYFGGPVLNGVLDRVRDAIADDNCLESLKVAIGDCSGYVVNELIPLVKYLDREGGTVYDVLLGNMKLPQVKPKEEKAEKRPVDASTLRSVVVGTNATSFDHTLTHQVKEKHNDVIPGRAPVWPPSGSYVLNRQRMQLQSYDSFPKNDSRLPSIASQEQPAKLSPTTSESKVPKQVRFVDSVVSHEPPKVQEQPDQQENNEGTSPTCMEWYRKYMDSILPMPSVPDHRPPPITPIYPPSLTSCSEDQSSREMAAALPLVWRYPGSKVAVTGGDWRTRTIVDPNQYLKTLAQRRYHKIHPDPVPDLRENHRFSKKYFFSGYHTSTFRG